MKKIIMGVTFSFLCLTTFSQQRSKDYYLKKSKNQKTTAWILLGGGTTMMIGGAIIYSRDLGDLSGGIAIAGAIADIVSIPFFLNAHNQKKRAAAFSFSNHKILWYQKNSAGFITQPSVTVRIDL